LSKNILIISVSYDSSTKTVSGDAADPDGDGKSNRLAGS